MTEPQTLQRIPRKGIFLGVCAGLAYRFKQPPWVFRIPFGFLAFCGGIGIIPYLLLWAYMSEASRTPDDYDARTEDLDEDFI